MLGCENFIAKYAAACGGSLGFAVVVQRIFNTALSTRHAVARVLDQPRLRWHRTPPDCLSMHAALSHQNSDESRHKGTVTGRTDRSARVTVQLFPSSEPAVCNAISSFHLPCQANSFAPRCQGPAHPARERWRYLPRMPARYESTPNLLVRLGSINMPG